MPSACRRIETWRMSEPVLAASVAGPAGRAVHSPKSRTGMPSERYPQSISSPRISRFTSTPKIPRRLRHAMIFTPQLSRWRRRISKISGNDESSATTLIGMPWWAIPAATASRTIPCPTAKISPPPGAPRQIRWISSASRSVFT